MLPIKSNTNQEGCNPISSNCVVWQGPDIPCITLCKGDSISDVTAKLAQQLCDLLDQLDITTFDLTCFNPTCPTPTNIHELLQFILDKICKIEGCVFEPCCEGDPNSGLCCKVHDASTNGSGCPQCVVNVAGCLQPTDPITGDIIIQMQLLDYITLIGNTICTLVGQMNTVNLTLTNFETRISFIENNCCSEVGPLPLRAPTSNTLIPTVCVIPFPPAEGTPIDEVVIALEKAFCDLRTATGLPSDIFNAIVAQCANLDSSPSLANRTVAMSGLPGWVTQGNYTNQADSIGNMWRSICDIRAAVLNIQNTCCPSGCEGLIVNMTATLSGSTLTVFFSGTNPGGFADCFPSGNKLIITDGYGAQYTVNIPVLTNLNSTGFNINLVSTPINVATDLNLELEGCWKNISTNTTCERCLEYNLINNSFCPFLTLTPYILTVNWSFNNIIGTPVTYDMQLWSADGTTLIQSQVTVNPPVGAVAGIFSGGGITYNTIYKVRLCITINSIEKCCPFGEVTTLQNPCPAAINIGADGDKDPVINLENACGFAVLAGTMVDNTGITNINGDLGVAPGVIVLGAPTVSGTTHLNDTAAIDAQISLIQAIIRAQAYAFTTDLTGQDLGVLVLNPGVFNFDVNANNNNILTLDGPGYYIFQIGNNLTTAAGSSINLINGATADKVFFQVGNNVSLGTSANFEGVIMATNNIVADAGTINGALMALNGAVTFNSGTTVNYIGC